MFKKLLVAAALGLTFGASSSAIAGESLFEQFPVSPDLTQTLKDGTEVTLPFHIQGTTTAIVSFVDSKEANKFVDHSQFKAVDITCNGESTGLGVGVLYVQDVANSPVGSYQETVNTIMVQDKSAPDMELGCPPPLEADALTKMNYLLTAFGIMGAYNQAEAESGLPHKYAMYNDHLELNSQDSINAGREIWGYPKYYSDFDVQMTESDFMVKVTDERNGKPILEFSYLRQIGLQTPLYNIGDNVIPERNIPSDDQLGQLSGVLATCDGTTGWIQPFVGNFEAYKNGGSRTGRALVRTGFDPVAVMEFTKVCGVAMPAYQK